MRRILISCLCLITLISCKENLVENESTETIDPVAYWGENPWPEIRKDRINTLLPEAMKAAGVDCWIVVCRENNNDPIADHIGGENAGGTAAFLFYLNADGFHSKVY